MPSHHLSPQDDFVSSFASFKSKLMAALNNTGGLNDENTIKLFDIWLANTKDERFLAMQQKAHKDDKEPWERGYDDD